MKRDGDMQTEAEAMINDYLNALQDHYNGQVRHLLMTHSETSWELVIVYYADGEVVRDYFYEIEWLENGCTINLQPFLVEPMLHDSVESLKMYISRYHY
jgi:hypothetical protein